MAIPQSASIDPQERRPLLENNEAAHTEPQSEESPAKRSSRSFLNVFPRFDTNDPRFKWVPLLGCLIIFTNEAEYFVKNAPLMRAIESLHCLEYYEARDPDTAALGRHIPERLCKVNAIQEAVAYTNATYMFVRMISATIGALPLGYLADRKGRRPILVLHKFNVIISNILILSFYYGYPRFPINALFVAGLPGLIGGNFDFGLALLFAAYTDTIPSPTQRASLFFVTTSMQYLAQLAIPPIGGALMNLDGQGGTPQVALLTSFGLSLLPAIFVIFFFPETMSKKERLRRKSSGHADSEAEFPSGNPKSGLMRSASLKLKAWQKNFSAAVDGVGVINMLLLALALFSASVGIKSSDWYGLVQYPVVKLHWSFSQATSVQSVQALVYILNFFVLLPWYNRLGVSRGLPPASISLLILLFSSILLITGATLLGFSASAPAFFLAVLIYTLGAGFGTATQTFIAGLIEKSMVGRVLAIFSISATVGKACASVMFPIAFKKGLDSGNEALKGLPFWVAAVLFAVAGSAAFLVSCRRDKSLRREL